MTPLGLYKEKAGLLPLKMSHLRFTSALPPGRMPVLSRPRKLAVKIDANSLLLAFGFTGLHTLQVEDDGGSR